MKPGFLFKPLTLILLFATISFSGCVQPYSTRAFYKGNGAGGNPPSTATASEHSLSSDDITGILSTANLSEKKLSERLRRVDPHWHVKGFDGKKGEIFYFNFYSADNKEAFIFHTNENSAEYVTTNANNYNAFVNNLKQTGYKKTSSSAQNGDNYSNGNTDVHISPVQIFDGSGGYKIFFTAAIK